MRCAHQFMFAAYRAAESGYNFTESNLIRGVWPMRSIPIDVLRAFVAVVEARGFTRAAEALGRTQPTVSLQVKRLEELIETPLFERSARFALTPAGAVCFDYGKRLLRLHDDMLDEAQRRAAPSATLRVGAPGAFAAPLAPGLPALGQAAGADGFELIADASDRLAAAFRQSAFDVALVETEEEDAAHRWRAGLAWFGATGGGARERALPLVAPLHADAAHRAAVGALRALGRKFDIVFASADPAALAAAAAAGLGLLPMVDGLQPAGLRRSADRTLPALAPVTLSLLARSAGLAEAGRLWVQRAAPKLQPI